MADISQIVLKDSSGNVIGTYDVKDATVPHTSEAAASGGTTLSLVTTGEKATWNAKSDTDNKVAQTATTTNTQYEVLFSGTADNTTRIEGARKNSNLTFNPSTGTLDTTEVAVSNVKTSTLNGVTVPSSPKFTDTTYTLSTTGNTVRLSANGVAQNDITVPYATNAGSATTAGSANTATSANIWRYARNFTVGNTKKSVDGNADVSFYNPLKFAGFGSDSANTSGWYKVMTVTQSGYSDTNLNLLITSGYSKNASGILHVHVRCNNSTTNSLQSLCWLSRYGWSIGDVYFKDHGNNLWSLYVYQANTQYGRVQVHILSEVGTTTYQQNITLTSSTTKEGSLSGGTASWEGALDLSSSLSVSGNLQSVKKKFFDHGGVVELFMSGNVKTAIADNAVFLTVPSGYNPKVNDVGFTFFTGSDQYIPTGMRFGYFTWGGRDFHTLGALSVGTQVTVHFTYLV